MKHKILIADDETRMRILVSDFLTKEGYEVLQAKDGLEAIELFGQHPDIHLFILDVMMPGMNGLEVCRNIRDYSKVPIIMLTAKVTEKDELSGFVDGADEYIKKPFSPTILVARVNALMKRSYTEEAVITKGCLTINTDEMSLSVANEVVNLSQTEFRLLMYFVDNDKQAISREQLINHVWGMDYYGTDRTVDTHIGRLRIKLKEAGSYITTVRGYGYKFEVTK